MSVPIKVFHFNISNMQGQTKSVSLRFLLLWVYMVAVIGHTRQFIGADGAVIEEKLRYELVQDHHLQESTPSPDLQGENGNEQNYDDALSEEEEEEKCIRLPPKSRKSSSSSPHVSIMNLLNDGSKYMAEDDAVKDIILIMGNTGCGKTTLTQIIAGDLRRLNGVLTKSGRLVIVDDDNRIGVPSTISKTLIPELVLTHDGDDDEESGNMTAFYDCPGFDDSRGPEQDLAANFFINQIIRKVARVKLLFLVIHSSVTIGNERSDFDNLVTHATKFLKNIPNYNKSIGLVVTKVEAFNNRGKPRHAKYIMKGITEFLTMYSEDIHFQLDSNSSTIPRSELEEKAKFVDVLLEQDKENRYGHISFSRSPTECGPLSNSKVVLETRKRIIKFYSEELHYVPVDPEDFGYTLKDSTKLSLRRYLISLNEQVGKGISSVINDFNGWHQTKYLDKPDISQISNEFRKAAYALKNLTTSLHDLEDHANPQAFLEILQPTLETLGYRVPIKVEKSMRQYQVYYDFFDEANGDRLPRSLGVWIRPVEIVSGKVEHYFEWYEFCKKLETAMGTYAFQLNKPKISMNRMDWLNVIETECNIQVSDKIKQLSSKLGRVHLGLMENIVRFALRPLEVKCEDASAVITGNYVRLSEFISTNWPLVSGCDVAVKQRHMEIFAAHTLFIDEDLEAEGMELNIVAIAPNWVVVGKDRHFNLNGATAPGHIPEVAGNKNNSNKGYGSIGYDGMAGKPGGPAGSFFGLALHTKDIGELRITSIGGKGGAGQHGGNGGDGSTPRNSTRSDAAYDHTSFDIKWYVFLEFTLKYFHEGFPGHPGGNGGRGGAPGVGGKPGQIKIHLGDEAGSKGFHFVNDYGSSGEPGQGGKGGQGSFHSMGIDCGTGVVLVTLVPIWNATCVPHEYNLNQSNNGTDGIPGGSAMGFVDSKPPTYTIAEWQSILNYKLSATPALWNTETKAFFQFLDNHPALRKYLGVEELVTELEEMSNANLKTMLSPYISKLERYTTENLATMTTEEKKVSAYLLASAYSKLLTSDQAHGMGMVVDLGQFFNVVKSQMLRIKRSSALAAIDDERHRFGKDIQTKIVDVKRFRDDLITPAIHTVEVKLQKNLRDLEMEFEGLIMDANANLEDSRKRITKMEGLNFKKILGIVKIILRFADGIGGFVDLVTKDLPVILDSAKEVFVDFTTLANNVMEVGSERGKGIESILESGMKLLKSAGELAAELSQSINEASSENEINIENRNLTTSPMNNVAAAASYLGAEMASNLRNKFKGDNQSMAKLNTLVLEAQERLKDARNRKVIIEKSFIPVVETLMGSLKWMMAELQNKSESSTVHKPELGIRKWQITWVLKDVKGQLEMLGKGVETKEFVTALDRVQDSLTMQIELIEDIVKYEETRKLADYMAAVNSVSLKNIQVSDPALSSAVARMEKAIISNSFMMDYEKALHAFKQWVFPFAKLHLTKDLQLKEDASEISGDAYIKLVELLQLQWERYKGSTMSAHDTHLIHTNFSSSHKSSSPFFTWKNEQWSSAIADLFSGKSIHLKADIRLSPKGRDAIKFKLIELNCKIPEGRQSQRENQQSLNSELDHFGVIITHSGLSYYRFQGKFYVMSGANQTIQYNFERDHGTGSRLGRNRVYEKFNKGDYLLSPYTLWTIQLATPFGDDRQRSFQGLERFAPYVDLELVGTGIYVNGNRIWSNMEVGRYYVRDESVREDIDF